MTKIDRNRAIPTFLREGVIENRRYTFILIAIILAGSVVVGVWYMVNKPAPRDLSMPPIYTEPDNSTEEVPQKDTVSYPHDDPDSPYIDLDAKLHVAKYVTLDSEIITINYELKDVALCGETYKVKQVMIDGVDVIQKAAALLAQATTSDYAQLCSLLSRTASEEFGGKISPGGEIHISIYKSDPKERNYHVDPILGEYMYSNRSGSPNSGMSILVNVERNQIGLGLYESELGTVVSEKFKD